MQRKPWWLQVVAVLVGSIVISLVAALQFRSRMSAYAGYESIMANDRFGISKMADGMFNSIISAMLLGATVLITTMIVVYVSRNIFAGVMTLVVTLTVLGVFGSLTAEYLRAHPIVLSAAEQSASYIYQWRTAAGETLFPGALGLVAGWLLVKRARAREYQDTHRPVVLSRAEREARDAEIAERERRARANREAALKAAQSSSAGTPPATAPTPTTSGVSVSETRAPAPEPVRTEPAVPVVPAASVVSTVQAVPAVPAASVEPAVPAVPAASTAPVAPAAPAAPVPPVAPAVPATPAAAEAPQSPRQQAERRAVRCRACGTSNAPIRDRCLKCGAILAPSSAN